MGSKTSIEWTNSSWTPIRARNKATGKVGWHCEHATPGCINCYAESLNKVYGTGLPFKPAHRHTHGIELFLDEKLLTDPLRWKRPRMIFVCSMTDLFADFVPDEWIDRIFAVMALCPQHTFQVLTKRSARMRDYFATSVANKLPIGVRVWNAAVELDCSVHLREAHPGHAILLDAHKLTMPLPNVWLGVSAEDRRRWLERTADLRETPAAIRFVSCEPLLEDLGQLDLAGIHWIIAGGESGRHARPMHPDWNRSIRDQCAAGGVAFHFKQWGEYLPVAYYGNISDLPKQSGETIVRRSELIASAVGSTDPADFVVRRVGKKAAGRLLDGVEHNGFPEVLVA